jgi:hypothetical protein
MGQRASPAAGLIISIQNMCQCGEEWKREQIQSIINCAVH